MFTLRTQNEVYVNPLTILLLVAGVAAVFFLFFAIKKRMN